MALETARFGRNFGFWGASKRVEGLDTCHLRNAL